MAEVTLVNSNVTVPPIAPLGLEYIAEACRSDGLDCEVLDLCFEADPVSALRRRLAEADTELIAFSFRNSDNCLMLSSHSFVPQLGEFVSAAREATEAPIVLGGAGFAIAPEAIMHAVGADYGVVGDGEESLPALFRALRDETDLQHVPGLLWHGDEGICRNSPAWPELVDRPGLRRDTVDNARYFRLGGQLGIETKRGCDRRCVYCADPLAKGQRVRLRSPEAVADEIANLLARDLDVFHTCDSEFNLDYDHACAVCRELIQRGLGESIRWYAYLTPQPFTDELAELMQLAGCVGINFGADSGNDEMLAALGRGFSPEHVLEAAQSCRQHGLAVMLDLLIGAPGETPDTARQTIEMAKAAEPSCVGISLGVRLYAGTKVAQAIAAEGPLAQNPGVSGQVADNEDLLAPVFYISPALGTMEEASAFMSGVIAGDERFFFGGSGDDRDYDYDDNTVLVEAIAAGARGAYWDILRQLRCQA